jgi:hypothetical protein
MPAPNNSARGPRSWLGGAAREVVLYRLGCPPHPLDSPLPGVTVLVVALLVYVVHTPGQVVTTRGTRSAHRRAIAERRGTQMGT